MHVVNSHDGTNVCKRRIMFVVFGKNRKSFVPAKSISQPKVVLFPQNFQISKLSPRDNTKFKKTNQD